MTATPQVLAVLLVKRPRSYSVMFNAYEAILVNCRDGCLVREAITASLEGVESGSEVGLRNCWLECVKCPFWGQPDLLASGLKNLLDLSNYGVIIGCSGLAKKKVFWAVMERSRFYRGRVVWFFYFLNLWKWDSTTPLSSYRPKLSGLERFK